MSFSLFGQSVTPADNATLFDSGPSNVAATPPPGMQVGDFVTMWCVRRSTVDIAQSATGGQSWTPGTLRQTGSSSVKIFTCQFNGTWTANPSIATSSNAAVVISVGMFVWRPTTTGTVVQVDVAEAFHTFNAPVTPFDVTAPSVTPIASDTMQIWFWHSLDKNTWGLQSPPAGVANAGGAQYRNVDNSGASKNTSFSVAYLVQAAANPTGTVTNRQLTLGGDPGLYLTYSYKEIGTSVTVSAAGDALFHNTETGITVTGTSFGASQGAGALIISPTNDINDAGAISQTVTSWADTSINFTAALSTFGYFSNIYLFVRNNAGSSNSTGFIVQREAWATLTYILKNKSGTVQASLSSLHVRVVATTLNGALVTSATNGTTDGSGQIVIGPVVLTSGGALAPSGDVWLSIATQGGSQATSPATIDRVTPTYT